MPRGATITDTQTTPPKTASASEQAENSSKLERPHPPGLSGAAPRPQIVGSLCRKLGWIEDTQTCRSSSASDLTRCSRSRMACPEMDWGGTSRLPPLSSPSIDRTTYSRSTKTGKRKTRPPTFTNHAASGPTTPAAASLRTRRSSPQENRRTTISPTKRLKNFPDVHRLQLGNNFLPRFSRPRYF